jgi:hypothetical protein
MANIIAYFRQHHHTIYSLIVSLLLVLWYYGVTGILNHFMPERGLYLSILIAVIPLTIFIIDDGNLDELYKQPNKNYPAIATTMNLADIPEKFTDRNEPQNAAGVRMK